MDFIKKAVEINPEIVWCFTQEMKDNKQIMLIALDKVPVFSGEASDSLLADPDIQRAAFSDKNKFIKSDRYNVNMEGIGVDFARWPEDWRRDRELLILHSAEFWQLEIPAVNLFLDTVKKYYSKDLSFFMDCSKITDENFQILLSVADESLFLNKEFMYMYIDHMNDSYLCGYGWMPVHVPDELKQDRDFMKQIISDFPDYLEIADDDIRADKEFVLLAVKKKGLLLQFADINLRLDDDVVNAAIAQNPLAIKYADDRFI